MSNSAHVGGNKKTFVALGVVIVVMVAAVVFLHKDITQTKSAAAHLPLSAEKMREYANKLKTEGLVTQAAQAYETYLQSVGADPALVANIYFLLGEAFMQKGAYEDALAYFYKAEVADQKRALAKDIGINIVTCFDRLGKSFDAQSALAERVSLDADEQYKNARGAVVAKIGSRMITMGEINDALAALPDWLQKEYADETQKALFIRQYVVNKLLVKKGLMAQYDKNPAIVEQLQEMQENLVVQQVIRENVTDTVKVDDHDVQTYYEAHKDSFTQKTDNGDVVPLLEDVRQDVERACRKAKSEVKLQSFLSDLLRTHDAAVFFNPEPKPVEEEQATTTEPVSNDEPSDTTDNKA